MVAWVGAAVNADHLKSSTDVPIWFQALLARDPKAEEEAFAALGRFVAAYALAEAGVHVAARHHSSLTEAKARVVFGGRSLPSMSEMLRTLASDSESYSQIDECLTQLQLIAAERGNIVHRVIEFDKKRGFHVSDKLTAKMLSSAERKTYALEQLRDMERDCTRIYFRLTATVKDLDGPEMTAWNISLLELYGAWRYKPPQPSNKNIRRRAGAGSRRNRHRETCKTR